MKLTSRYSANSRRTKLYFPNKWTAEEINVTGGLSALSADLGTITAGVLQSADWAAALGIQLDLDNKLLQMGGSGVDFAGSQAGVALGLTDAKYQFYVGNAGDKFLLFDGTDVILGPDTLLTQAVAVTIGGVAGWAHGSDLTKMDGADIYANSITASQILANTITATEIAAGTITATELKANSVGASEIISGVITSDHISANTIDAGDIAANAIGTSELAANSVEAGHIVAGSVDTSELAADAVTADKIDANTITASEIAANAITASELNALAVEAGHISAAAVEATHMAANSITAANAAIANLAVDTLQIAGSAVETDKINARAVTIPASDTGSASCSTGTTTNVASATFTSTGVDVHVQATMHITGLDSDPFPAMTMVIRRDTTDLLTHQFGSNSYKEAVLNWTGVIDDNTTAASHTYHARFYVSGDTVNCAASILCLEVKK